MEVRIEITRHFDADVAALDPERRRRVEATIDDYSRMVKAGPVASSNMSSHRVKLKGGLHSSLYSLRVHRELRVLLATDHDPIFKQTVVTLLRVVKRDEFDRALGSMTESLYQDLLYREES